MLQESLILKGILGRRLKPVSQVFIAAELLDITTTFMGLALIPQMWEANPLPGLLGGMYQAALLKLCATLAVVWVLEKVESWPRLVWIVPVLASSPVLWNMLMISFEFMHRYSTYLATYANPGGAW